MAAHAQLSPAQRRFILRQKVARLATVDSAGQPHAVPICYVFDGQNFYSPIDEKPKRVASGKLQRLRNIEANPRVCLVIDRYSSDWSRLCWVQVRALASLVEGETSERRRVLALLRKKYSQYGAMDLESKPLIRMTPQRVVAWGNL